jgi:hypothetical protein
MRRTVSVIVLLIGLFAGLFSFNNPPLPTHAQGITTPIIFLLNGDIYSYDVQSATTTQLTTWGYNEAPILSPDGTYFVYNSWASQFVETLVGGTFGYIGSPPSNLWLWEVSSGDATRIAEQPANMIPPTTTEGGNGIIRSTPVWSPDGAQIAWTEAQLPDYGYRLMTYNLATESSRVLVDRLSLGFQDGGIVLQTPTWGSGGIALARWDGGNAGFEQTLTIYHPFDGSIVYSTVVSSSENGALANVWLDDVENTIALAYRGHWEMLNVVTGQRTQLSGVGPYSRLAASNTTFPVTAGYTESSLSLQIPAGSTFDSASLFQLHLDVAISPDGNSMAYVNDALYVKLQNQITVRVNGTTLDTSTSFGLNHGVVWGPIGWRRVSNGVAPAIVDNCSPIPRLSGGGRARVIAGVGGGNVLRALPQTGEFSDELTVIPEGGTMNVLRGPVCQDNFNWWLVEYNNRRGWTPEGDAGTYWLEPTS